MSGKIMIWSAFVFLCAVQLCNGNVGTILKDFGEFQLRKVDNLVLVCNDIDSSEESADAARANLNRYVGGPGNVEGIMLRTQRPTERIVDDDFEGKLCFRLYPRDDYPDPIESLDITVEKIASRSLYVKQFEDDVIFEKVETRVTEFEQILADNDIDDVDITVQYIMKYMPGLFEVGFKKE